LTAPPNVCSWVVAQFVTAFGFMPENGTEWLAAFPKQEPDNDKNYNSSQAAAAQFPGTDS